MNYFKQLFSFPTFLTILRIILSPIFFVLLLSDKSYLPLGILIFTIAALTDFGDGYFARRHGIVTKLGSFLDPLADKILIVTAFFAFYFLQIIDLWIVVLIIFRDVMITLLRMVLLRRSAALKTSALAKLKTVFQLFSIYLIFAYLLSSHWFEDIALHNLLKLAVDFVMYFVVVFTVWTGIDYFIKNRQAFKGENEK